MACNGSWLFPLSYDFRLSMDRVLHLSPRHKEAYKRLFKSLSCLGRCICLKSSRPSCDRRICITGVIKPKVRWRLACSPSASWCHIWYCRRICWHGLQDKPCRVIQTQWVKLPWFCLQVSTRRHRYWCSQLEQWTFDVYRQKLECNCKWVSYQR